MKLKDLSWIMALPSYILFTVKPLLRFALLSSSSAIVQNRLKSCVYMIDTKKLRESSVSEMMTNNAVFLLPMSPKSSSSYAVISLTSLISNGASLAPQETRILLAVLPETNCQGLFHQIQKEVTFCGLPHGADA